MSKHVFFLFGLPRTRTAWFSNLLTTDRSFCYHEALGFCPDISALIDATDQNVVGFAEPNPQLEIHIPDKYKAAPRVYIHRPLADSRRAIEARYKKLDADLYWEAAESHASRMMNDGDVLKMDFKNLTESLILKIWKHLLPQEINPDIRRIRQLMYMNVQIHAPSLEDLKKATSHRIKEVLTCQLYG